jgi:OTU domain-containing protein 6
VEADFAAKFQELKAKYELEEAGEETVVDPKTDHSETTTTTTTTTAAVDQAPPPPPGNDAAAAETETEQQLFQRKKVEKAARKREQARQKELLDQQALAAAQALPNAKDTELERMQLPDRAMIVEVIADGHCLYRAIAAQLNDTNNNNGNKNKNTNDYQHVRQVAADALLRYRDRLVDFCEASHYDDYVDRVRNSADWGGHLELRALSLAFQRPIVVYSTGPPLMIGGGGDDDDVMENDQARDNTVEPIRLSYHLHYYALGEHYNRVVIKQETPPETQGDAVESS